MVAVCLVAVQFDLCVRVFLCYGLGVTGFSLIVLVVVWLFVVGVAVCCVVRLLVACFG